MMDEVINNLIFRGKLKGCPSCHGEHIDITATLTHGKLEYVCITTGNSVVLRGSYPISINAENWTENKGDISHTVTFNVDVPKEDQ